MGNSKNIIIVHGEKSQQSGLMHKEFIHRLDVAVSVSKNGDLDFLVITGGQTRKNIISEAEAGRNYLQAKVNVPIILESKSKSTSENVRFTKKILSGIDINQVCVIDSQKRMSRVKFFYSKFWSELYSKIEFKPVQNSYGQFYFLKEWMYFVFAILDPYEKTVAYVTKKLFRNA